MHACGARVRGASGRVPHASTHAAPLLSWRCMSTAAPATCEQLAGSDAGGRAGGERARGGAAASHAVFTLSHAAVPQSRTAERKKKPARRCGRSRAVMSPRGRRPLRTLSLSLRLNKQANQAAQGVCGHCFTTKRSFCAASPLPPLRRCQTLSSIWKDLKVRLVGRAGSGMRGSAAGKRRGAPSGPARPRSGLASAHASIWNAAGAPWRP